MKDLAKHLGRRDSLFLGFLVIAGLLIRWPYIAAMPITNDEGAYLYDALHITRGLVPYRDFLAKAPVLVYALAGWIELLGRSIWAGRLMMALVGVLTGLMLYWIGRDLYNHRVGLVAAVLGVIYPTAAVYTIYVHSEPLQVLAVTLAVLVLVKANRRQSQRLFFTHGAVLAVAFLIRQTTLAIFLVTGFTAYASFPDIGRRVRALGASAVGFGALMIPVLLAAWGILGWEKTLDVLGVEMVRQASDARVALAVGEQLVFVGKLWGEALVESPSIVRDAWVLTLSVPLFMALLFLRRGAGPQRLATGVGFLVLVYLGLRISGFDYLGAETPYRLALDFIGLGYLVLVLLAIALQARDYGEERTLQGLQALPLVWLLALATLYSFWIKFRTPYYGELLPPLALISGSVLSWLWGRLGAARSPGLSWVGRGGLVLVVAVALAAGYWQTLTRPSMGTLPPRLAESVALDLEAISSHEDEVLTAAVIIPFLTGNPVVRNISHPSWYGYPWIPPDLLTRYFLTFDEFAEDVKTREVPFIIVEGHTWNSYFRLHPEFESWVQENYEIVNEYPPSVGTIRLFRIRDHASDLSPVLGGDLTRGGEST